MSRAAKNKTAKKSVFPKSSANKAAKKEKQLKEFATVFYSKYGGMMSQLSHE